MCVNFHANQSRTVVNNNFLLSYWSQLIAAPAVAATKLFCFSYYLKAQELAPKNGKPYNQLAVIAIHAVSVCVCVSVCLSVCLSVSTYTCVCMLVCLCSCVHVCVCMYVCAYLCLQACILCVYVCTCVCMQVHDTCTCGFLHVACACTCLAYTSRVELGGSLI